MAQSPTAQKRYTKPGVDGEWPVSFPIHTSQLDKGIGHLPIVNVPPTHTG